MRKLFTLMLILLAVLVGFVGDGSSMNRPYNEHDLNIGGSLDDHPWGGDNAGGGSDGTIIQRPWYYSSTGYWAVDLMFNHVVNFYWRHTGSQRRTIDSNSTTTREVTGNTPTTNTAQ